MPFEYCSILFFHYCFENTAYEIDDILQIENTKSKLLYVQRMLSGLMRLENSWIDDNSIKEACKLSLSENMKEYYNNKTLYQPNYSKAFRKKLKDIKAAQIPNRIPILIAKRAAVFILVCILSFSAV